MTKRAKILSLALVLVLLVSLATVFALPSSAATYYVTCPPEGDYYVAASADNSYCMDVKGGSTARGTYVQLWQRVSGCAAQIFTIKRETGHWYTIRNKATGLCLNVPNGWSRNGQQLWMWSYDATDSCLWRFADAGNGRYILQNKKGRVLDLDNNLRYNGSRMHLWDLHDGDSAKWALVPVSQNLAGERISVKEGSYRFKTYSYTSRCLNIQYKSTACLSANTVLDRYDGESNEEFTVTHIGNNYYTIAPNHCTGRYLCMNGSKVTLASRTNLTSTHWYFVDNGRGILLINRSTGKALSLSSYSIGATVKCDFANKYAMSQMFLMEKVNAWASPLKGNVVTTQRFGNSGHLGVDMVSYTDINVYAAATGTVYAVGLNGSGTDAKYLSDSARKGNGYYVVLKHVIDGKTVYSMYGHLKQKPSLEAGATVVQGQVIGTMGNTGRSYGDHLHFAIANQPRNGSYYGYTASGRTFNADSQYESRSGVTFYNPAKAVSQGILG